MPACIEMCPVIGWIAGDDAVVIARVPLCFGERFQTSLGASAEIGMFRRRAIEGPDDSLVGFGRDMYSSMGEIDHPLHVSLRPMRVVIRNVASIGAAGC